MKEPLRVLQLHLQRQNALQVLDKLELMFNVHQAQPTIQVGFPDFLFCPHRRLLWTALSTGFEVTLVSAEL